MTFTNIRLRLKKEETSGTVRLMALTISLVLFIVGTAHAQTADPQTSRLIGTIQSENFTGAVFSDPKGEQSFFRSFDKLPDGSQIVAVRSDSISLKGTDGTSYDMYIAHDMTVSSGRNAAAPAGPDVSVDPYMPRTLQTSDPEKQKMRPKKPRGSRDRTRSNEE